MSRFIREQKIGLGPGVSSLFVFFFADDNHLFFYCLGAENLSNQQLYRGGLYFSCGKLTTSFSSAENPSGGIETEFALSLVPSKKEGAAIK